MEAGSVVIVTGATRGIGRAVALELAAAGARLVLVGRTTRHGMPHTEDGRTLEDIEELAVDAGAEVATVAGDVSDAECVVRVRTRTFERFGRCDAIVNAASTVPMGPFMDVAPSRWMQGFSVNVMAPVLLAQALLPDMLRSGGGRILSVSAAAAMQQDMFRLAHEVTRAGVDPLTVGLDAEFGGRGIAVNAVRVDEPLVGLDNVTLPVGVPATDSPNGLSVAELALAICWVLDQPVEFRGRVLSLGDLRAAGALK